MNEAYQDYLAHHGIKGQKWGVRRYQNEDGSLTSAGKKRAESGDPKKKELSEEERQARRDKAKKIAGIAAAVAVTAVAAHYVSKGLAKADRDYYSALERGVDPMRPFKKDLDNPRNSSYIVPKGSKIQRLSRFDESKAKGHAYVTFDPEDNERYKGFFGKLLTRTAAAEKAKGATEGTEVYVHDIVAREHLWSPSKRDRIQTFLNMYKDDPIGMGKTLGNYHTKEFHDTGWLPKFVYRRQYANLHGSQKITKGYRTFVKAIGDEKNKKLRDSYFERLGKMGYNMIQDDQDSGRSGIKPSIVLDRSRSLSYNGKRTLLGDEVKEHLKKYGRRVSRENRHREWL